MRNAELERLKQCIREVPDFPKKGINFKDITSLLREADKFKLSIDRLVERYKGKQIDVVVGIEARGFILAGAVAYTLGTSMVPVRKKGKLPWRTRSVTYQLEYGTDTLEVHQDSIQPGERVVIIDDLLATGGTTKAVVELIEALKGEIVEVAFLIELGFLNGREKLKRYPVFSLIKFD